MDNLQVRAKDLLSSFLKRRTPNVVVPPYVGSNFKGLAVVGEAPAEHEINQVCNFVGPSGKVLETAMSFNKVLRSEFVIDNICPVRLPAGYQLTKADIDILKSALWQRLIKNNVKVVLACGLSAIRAFFDPPAALENFRGRIFDVTLVKGYTVKVIPTYHPAVLFKPNAWMGFFWYICFDLGIALKVLEGKEPYDSSFGAEILYDFDEVETWIKKSQDFIAFDFEATSKNPFFAVPYCVAMSDDEWNGACVPLRFVDPSAMMTLDTLIGLLKKYKKTLIVHNSLYDIALIRKYDLKPPPFVDTMYRIHTRFEYLPKGLKDLGSFFCRIPVYSFNFGQINRAADELVAGLATWDEYFKSLFTSLYKYNVVDSISTVRIHNFLRKFECKNDRAATLYRIFVHPLLEELVEVSKNGLFLDLEKTRQVEFQLESDLSDLESRITVLLPSVKNVRSTAQLGKAFKQIAEQSGFSLPKTQKGNIKVDQSVLNDLSRRGIQSAKLLLEYRKKKKLLSTYVKNYSSKLDENSRVHTQFSLAETMRLKSSDPALQVIPRKSIVLSLFDVSKLGDRLILKVDYSSAEARVFAFFSGEELLTEPNLDVHKAAANLFFGIPIDQVTPEKRQQIKAIFFGKIYGSGIYRLAQQLNCSYDEAQQKEAEFFAKFPGIQKKMKEWESSVVKKGKVVTPLGICRHFLFHKRIHEMFPKSETARQFFAKAIREGYNTPPQSTVAYLTNRSLIKLNKTFRKRSMKTRVCLQLHDALYFEVAIGETWKALELVYKVMREPVFAGKDFFVPIEVFAGFNLLDQIKIVPFNLNVSDFSEVRDYVSNLELPTEVKRFFENES